ncbi:hypothetical protein LIER_38418 [Lithospermum erythrorhizon]|uniref:Pentatricopeptide repeat-containing protein n=1 Tax=Lithospermum erythrorhizon TaxID=34254 RepID=A0AAV3PZY3_LITER
MDTILSSTNHNLIPPPPKRHRKPPPHNHSSFKPPSPPPHSASSRIKKTPNPSNSKQPKNFTQQDAFPKSLPLHNKNPHAIYQDIQRFANQRKIKEALTILDYLEQKGVPVNVTTLGAVIEACVKRKAVKEGGIVHAHVRINGFESNEYLQTKLVHMYASFGCIEDAKKVFDEMPVRSVYPWNALLRGNVVLGGRNYKGVLGTFLEMRELGVDLNVYSFSCLIKSLAGARAFYQGLKAHGLLIKNGLLDDRIIRTCLIDMYFKCGKVKLGCRVFEEVEERDVVVWGTIISGFAHNRLGKEALEFVRWMISEGLYVNSVILTIIIPVIGDLWARRIGKEVHAYVIKTKEYSKQLFIQSSLIDMYCKCGDMVSGRKVFYASEERNAISWTALLSGYVANGRLEQALRSIIWMQQEGFKPDVVTLATVLPVCGKLKALRQGKEIHAYTIKRHLLPNVSVETSLMMMYSNCGLLEYSLGVFSGMERKNVISWTGMIDSYLECRCLNEALGVFRDMQLSKHRPDSVAMARILRICAELEVLNLGREIHGQILKKDLESIPFVSAELIKMYGKCGAIGKANLAFDATYAKGAMTWTAIIEAYGCNGLYQEAIDLFQKMMSDGFSPNHYTLEVVLRICELAGFADEACRFFSLMTERYKIKATEEHYTIIIDLLTHLGLVEKAQRFMRLKESLVVDIPT